MTAALAMMLRICADLSLPPELITETIAAVAKRRMGKSFFARRTAEQVARLGFPFVIIDPKGDHWGIRSSCDGLHPGFPILILGGHHGDLPLDPSSGEAVARLVVEDRVSLLIDLSAMRKHEIATFCAAFLEALYRLKAATEHQHAMLLIIDEADAIAPQHPAANEARMVGAASDVVRRGGQRGIGCMVITQRCAVLSKDVLTQAQLLVVFRTIAKMDRKRIDEWIEVHGTPEQRAILLASLASLQKGDAWFWSPGWPTEEGIFQRSHVLPIETWDSGATPKPGQPPKLPKVRAPVDLAKARSALADAIARVEANDPIALKRQIAELERKLAAAMKGKLPVKEVVKMVAPTLPPPPPMLSKESMRLYASAQDQIAAAGELIGRASSKLQEAGAAAARVMTELRQPPARPARAPAAAAGGGLVLPPPPAKEIAPPPRIDGVHPSVIKICRALVGCGGAASRGKVGALTGFAPKGSTMRTYVQKGRSGGLFTGKDPLVITPAGREIAGQVEQLQTHDEILAMWVGKFGGPDHGTSKVLTYLCQNGATARDALEEATGYRGSTMRTYLQKLRSASVIEKGDPVAPSPSLWP